MSKVVEAQQIISMLDRGTDVARGVTSSVLKSLVAEIMNHREKERLALQDAIDNAYEDFGTLVRSFSTADEVRRFVERIKEENHATAD